MSQETLEPGEWGPFEELSVAAAEIMRLRQIIRSLGANPDDSKWIPTGHLVYQPASADLERGRAHKTTWLEWADQAAEIDEPIAPLMLEIWKAGIRTTHSCQENPRGFIWIEFASPEDARQFLQIAIPPRTNKEMFDLYRRAFREGPAGFWSLSRNLWLFKVLPISKNGQGIFDPAFLLSVRFPQEDLPQVIRQFQMRQLFPSGGCG